MAKKRKKKDPPKRSRGPSGVAPQSRDLAGELLEIANRLRVLAMPMTLPESPCLPPADSKGAAKLDFRGCYKFATCDIHPEALKALSIDEIQEHHREAYEQLKSRGCLRVLAKELGSELDVTQLALGDFIGARADDSHRDPSMAPQPVRRTCAYFGCAVPELAARSAEPPGEAAPPFVHCCPFARVLAVGSPSLVSNPYRYVACKLTRPDFRSLHRRLQVVSISPVAILPGPAIRSEVFYLGRNRAAPYQYLAWNPGPNTVEPFRLPEEQLRLHAPRLVRQYLHSPDAPGWGARGAEQTIHSFQLLNAPTGLSNFERTVGVRYIPAGEFNYLTLMWYWSGELAAHRKGRPGAFRAIADRGALLRRNERWRRMCRGMGVLRDVVIEHAESDRQDHGQSLCLLKELLDLGFQSEIEALFGQIKRGGEAGLEDHDILVIEAGGEHFARRSCRLEDLVRLGLLRRGESANGVTLTERAASLAEWLLLAVEAATNPPTEPLSPLAPQRCRKLLQAEEANSERLSHLRQLAEEMVQAAGEKHTGQWLIAVNEFLELFPKENKRRFRKFLRDEGFPVYPLVHLILLSGISVPLDWTGIPFGGTVLEEPNQPAGAARAGLKAQGGVFLLSVARPPEEAEQLVTQLQPVLLATLLPQLGQWTDEVVAKTLRVAEFASVVSARKHVHVNIGDLLYDLRDPAERQSKMKKWLEDPDKCQQLLRNIGELLAWSDLAVEDGRRFAALVKQGWEWKEEAVTIRELFEHVGKLLEPRAKITFTWVPEGAERLKVCVLYHAAFHLLLECMRNTLRHDHDPYHAGHEVKWEVLIGHQADERRVRVAIHNNRARFEHDDIRRFREYKASHGVDTLLRELPDSGLKTAWSLALLTGCDLDLDNAQLGSQPIPVGSTKITFQTGGESGTSTPAG